MISARAGRNASLAAMLCGSVTLAGCMGPTYGTGVPAGRQLLEDVSSIGSTGRQARQQQQTIAYSPRPELVQPPTYDLPPPRPAAPQATVDATQSTEAQLAQMRAEAAANRRNPALRAPEPIISNQNPASASMTASQRNQAQQIRSQQRQGTTNTRRYLSEPPLVYRDPRPGAAAGDLGVDEWRKDRAAGIR